MGQITVQREQKQGFIDLIKSLQPNIGAVLPKHLTPERMVKVVLTAAIRVPELYLCTRETIIRSVMDASQLGLDCGGVLGSAYLIPFRNNRAGTVECQLIVGYRGMIDLARRSGQILSIAARPVYEGDAFELEYGLGSTIRHVPSMDVEESKANFRRAYMVAQFIGGGHHIEVMSARMIEAIRARSRAGNAGPWVTDYIEMAKKTVVRRGFKWLPMSTEMQDRFGAVAERGGGVIEDIIDGEAKVLPADETIQVDDETTTLASEMNDTAAEVAGNIEKLRATNAATSRSSAVVVPEIKKAAGAAGKAVSETPATRAPAPKKQQQPATTEQVQISADDIDDAFGGGDEGGAA